MILAIAVSAEDIKYAVVGHISFPIKVHINSKTLKLNGLGARDWLVIQMYIAALYLEHPLQNAETVIHSQQTKYVLIHLDSNFITFRGFKYTIDRGLKRNLSDSELLSLLPKLKRFYDICRKLNYKRGDRIGLFYEAKAGLSISYNGEFIGSIEGDEVMIALYNIWLGRYPDSIELKEKLLGIFQSDQRKIIVEK